MQSMIDSFTDWDRTILTNLGVGVNQNYLLSNSMPKISASADG